MIENESYYPNSLLNVYPGFDQASMFTHMYGKVTQEKIEESYPNLTSYPGRRAIRENIESALESAPDCFFHWDHGNKEKMGGWGKDIIVDLDNVELLANMHVHSYSCQTAAKLGPEAIKAGAYSYVGFRLPAMVCLLAEPFQRAAAIYYPVHLTHELEKLQLELPDPEQEIEVVKRVFKETKDENYRQAMYAMTTLFGGIIMLYNVLHLTLLTASYEKLGEEIEEEEEMLAGVM